MNITDTTRTYPRSLRTAFPLDYRESAIGINGPVVIHLHSPWWIRIWRAIKGAWA